MSIAKSGFQAMIACKCPRCRAGNIFPGSMYGLKIQRTNDSCSNCHLKYEREPGYFYVAMFVSYGMTVIEILAIGIFASLMGLDLIYENLWYYVSLIMAGIVLLSPFNYRYSRVILLHWLTPGLNFIPGFGEAAKGMIQEDVQGKM